MLSVWVMLSCFFFSSRRRHTRLQGDWSSDVCSSDLELAVEAMKLGADDYIAKGRLQIDELEMRIARALRHQNLEVENVTLRQQLDSRFRMENTIGESDAMKEVLEVVRQVAPTRAAV